MDMTYRSKPVEKLMGDLDLNMDERQEANVCEVCKNLDTNHFQIDALTMAKSDNIATAYHRELPRDVYILNIVRPRLERSVRDGCFSCKIIDQARRVIVSNTLDLYFSHISIFKFYDDEPLRFALSNASLNADSMASRISSTHFLNGMIYTPSSYSGPLSYPSIGTIRNIHNDALSLESLELAKKWFEVCLSAHLKCSTHTACILPQRVIWVGANNNDVRLVSNLHEETGIYATLSYYWAEVKEELQVHSVTLENFKQGIPFDKLPKTFQDAIKVTRVLGIPYLWIDILCMVQRTDQDWCQNSNQTHDIYGNAELNISADDCSALTMGLSSPLRAFGAGKEISPDIYARRTMGGLDPLGLSHIEDAHAHDLWKRSWSLQERMLSRRILHFTAYELSWECDSTMRCECSAEIRPADRRRIREFIKDSGEGKRIPLKPSVTPRQSNDLTLIQTVSKDAGKEKLPETSSEPNESKRSKTLWLFRKDSGKGKLLETSGTINERKASKLFWPFSKDSRKGKSSEASGTPDGGNGTKLLDRSSIDRGNDADPDSDIGELPEANSAPEIWDGLEFFEKISQEFGENSNKGALPELSDVLMRGATDKDNSSQLWASICYTYTALSPHPKHPLKSIAGLAFKFGEKTSLTYAAGLWKEHLPWTLIWRGLSPVRRRRPNVPTWSWASVSGEVAILPNLGSFLQEDPHLASLTEFWLEVKEISSENQYAIDFPTLNCRSMKVNGWICIFTFSVDKRTERGGTERTELDSVTESDFVQIFGKEFGGSAAYGAPKPSAIQVDFDGPGPLQNPCYLLFVAMLDAMHFLILSKVKHGDLGDEDSLDYYERVGWGAFEIKVAEFEKMVEFLKFEETELLLV